MSTIRPLLITAQKDDAMAEQGVITRIRMFLAAPRRRRLVIIGAAGVAYLIGLAVALRFDWYPQGLPGYVYLGLFAVLGAATARRWPVETLVLVTCYTAYTTLAPLPPQLYGLYLGAPQALVPLAIVVFIMISDGGPVVAPAATFGTLALLVILPWRDIVGLLVESRPLSEALLLDSGEDRSVLVAELVACALVIVFALMLRRQRRVAEELAAKNRELTQLRAAEVSRIAEQERTRIARGMHDEVAHHVAALVIRAQAALRVANGQPEPLEQAMRDIATSGQDVLARIRTVVRVLKSPPKTNAAAPLTLIDELEALFARVRSIGYDVDAAVRVSDEVPAEYRSAIAAAVQESLTNTMLHSAAHSVQVEVAEEPLVWTVRVSDPGPARERFADMPKGGSGLEFLADRLASLGGQLTSGTDGEGWTVTAQLPRTAAGTQQRKAAL
ncbi:sensor histidine kinase [Agreia pratensis]|uniref:histidine kinase n=1 Tax=Agreia pratensis TaxID=150121 RepID=A0A1X7KTQ6_9MICO|nr:histidine kinase [Agreia pratensis]SMG44277.1 Signal transduction histidine kinase [Agreia pratensis]